MPDYFLESKHASPVAGVDEAGYGPWAGPVVAAAVVLDIHNLPSALLTALDDSKKLTKAKRESLFKALYDFNNKACWIGVGEASPQEIDRMNVRVANLNAMQRAIESLPLQPAALLVDGINAPPTSIPCYKIIKGDSLSLSIAAASIIAKVTRDKIMSRLSSEYPHYLWDKNAGYGTKAHHSALRKYGVTPYHRQSYKPIRAILATLNAGLEGTV